MFDKNAVVCPTITLTHKGEKLPLTPFNIEQAMLQLRDEYLSLVNDDTYIKVLLPQLQTTE